MELWRGCWGDGSEMFESLGILGKYEQGGAGEGQWKKPWAEEEALRGWVLVWNVELNPPRMQTIALKAKCIYISAFAFSWLLLFASRFKTRNPRSWKCEWDQATDCAQELGAIWGIRKPQKSSREVGRMANFLFMDKIETQLDAGRWAETLFPSWCTLIGFV